MLSHPRSPRRLHRQSSGLLVVDVQTRLMQTLPDRERVLSAIGRTLEGAAALAIPSLATTQYEVRLGGVHSAISSGVTAAIDKRSFSAGESVIGWLQSSSIEQLVIVGVETHVCVLQTALDLLAGGYDIFVCADAVTAGNRFEHEQGLARMASEGVVITSVESTLFEWCETSEDPQFKRISEIVKRGRGSQRNG
jgi:nicotinamidase-related amidase